MSGNIFDGINIIKTVENEITASVVQAQGQQPITKDINNITVVGNAGDVVTLPPATTGMSITVYNNGANSMDVFPATDDAIDALAVNTAQALANGNKQIYNALTNALWLTVI